MDDLGIYPHFLLVHFTQGMDGLLGVAGTIMKTTMKWIIPENSLRLAPVSNLRASHLLLGICGLKPRILWVDFMG